MEKRTMLTGNYAAAYGARLARVEVVPVFPITPQTHIMEKMAAFIESGDLDAEFVPVESEHSAMAVAIAAQATGARTFTASSSQGLVYMHENLFVASGLRLPVVMAMVNRTIGAPTTICPDLGDSLDQRDTGWIQIYAESAQEGSAPCGDLL
jgi:pyruvate/2-oxoacid:ferredoxin oxidoreductase alpha subunit